MTAILVLLTFVAFVAIDAFFHRRQRAESPAPALATPAPAPAEPVFVSGYQLPENLHYHPGHTWVRVDSDDTVTVGLDDFASKLAGRSKSVRLPQAGDFLRCGAKSVRLDATQGSTSLVAPVEGEVLEVNPDLRREPALATWDPYGRGWLFRMRPSDTAAGLRNLMSGRLARHWTEDSSRELNLRLMALSGSVLQDGGTPAADFAGHLDPSDWKRLTDQFFLA
jgi:glycine cleavage system H lipoate-binding protein